MFTLVPCTDALDIHGLLADTTLRENDLSRLSAPILPGLSAKFAESLTPPVVGGAPSLLATVEAEEEERGPLPTMLRHAAVMRPELFRARTKLGGAFASRWVPQLVVGDVAARHPRINLARAEANAVRLSTSAANPLAAKTGNRQVDALARLAAAIGERRLESWTLLAELRAAACISVDDSEVAWARRELAYALQELNILATRRQQALRDGGKAEAVFQLRMDRSRRAAEISELYLDRADYTGECMLNEVFDAAYELISIERAIYQYRADAWWHIAKCNERSARCVTPDPAAVADLRHCRARIAELHAELPAASAAAKVEWEAQKTNGLLSAVTAGDRPDNVIVMAEHAPVFVSSCTVTIALSAV